MVSALFLAVTIVSFTIVVPTGRHEEFLNSLRSFKGPTEVAPGCIRCRILQDMDDHQLLTYSEEWRTDKELQDHVRSARYRQLLVIIDQSMARPEIYYHTVTKTKGLEIIEALRMPTKE